MTNDTAHRYWNEEWQRAGGTSKWARAEAKVMAHAAQLPKGARVLDLGAGIGRNALIDREHETSGSWHRHILVERV